MQDPERRPRLVLGCSPSLDLFTLEDIERLASVAELIDTKPIGDWRDPRADELLGCTEVILGHWGCPSIDGDVLERAPALRLFAYAAGSIKATVAPEVFDRDIRVTSGAPANAEPVAEFTLATILFVNKYAFWQRDVRRTPDVRALPDFRQESSVAIGNYDKTIGIVGASLVGRRVIELLASFPALSIALYDPFVTAEDAMALGVIKMELTELCAASDIVSVHAPELPATIGMIGADELAAMRTGATLVNTARGKLVDTDALVAEVSSGRLSAVLDVTEPEPLPVDHPFRSLPNVYLTPHLAGSQGTELRRMLDHAVDEIDRWRTGRPARNAVTKDQLDRLA